MLDYSIMHPEGILVLKPQAPLSKEDFNGLAAAVDAYLAQHDKLHGVMIHAHDFPGWEDIRGFTAHFHFVREHHKQIERVALVTDSRFVYVAESFARHFTSADIKHFPYADDAKALAWLEENETLTVGG